MPPRCGLREWPSLVGREDLGTGETTGIYLKSLREGNERLGQNTSVRKEPTQTLTPAAGHANTRPRGSTLGLVPSNPLAAFEYDSIDFKPDLCAHLLDAPLDSFLVCLFPPLP